MGVKSYKLWRGPSEVIKAVMFDAVKHRIGASAQDSDERPFYKVVIQKETGFFITVNGVPSRIKPWDFIVKYGPKDFYPVDCYSFKIRYEEFKKLKGRT